MQEQQFGRTYTSPSSVAASQTHGLEPIAKTSAYETSTSPQRWFGDRTLERRLTRCYFSFPLFLLSSFAMILCEYTPIDSAEPVVVLDGLISPWGITVQAESDTVYVAESGAGRIIRVVDGQAVDVVRGFPREGFGDSPKYTIGPLGLAFHGKTRLIVGGGGRPDGDELVGIYDVSGSAPIEADQAKFSLGPLAEGDQRAAEGNFFGVAVTKAEDILVTCNGEHSKGYLARIPKKGIGYGNMQRFIAMADATDTSSASCVTMSPRNDIVVGKPSARTDMRDSMVCWLNTNSGALLLNLKAGLFDISGLAFSPQSGLLFALDCSWNDPTKGGLYRLDASDQEGVLSIKAVQVAALVKPTALAFAKDGSLYVCTLGPGEGGEKPTGQLLKFPPM